LTINSIIPTTHNLAAGLARRSPNLIRSTSMHSRLTLRASIAILIIASTSATAVAQQDSAGGFRRANTILKLRFALPGSSWKQYQSSIQFILNSLADQQPELITNAVSDAFPNAEKPIVVVPDSMFLGGGKTKYGKTRISIEAVHLISTDREYLELMLHFEPPLHRDAGFSSRQEFLDFNRRLSRGIEEAIAKAFPDFSKDILSKSYADQEKQLTKNLADWQTKAADARNDLSRFSARTPGLPPEKFAEQLAEISRQQIAAELALVGMQARDQAINDEIKKTELRLASKTDSDETIKNLITLLQMRIDRFDSLKKLQAAGVAPTQELQSAEADVLSAKIELDKTRAALKRTSGGDQLDALNNELSRLAIDRAETLARRDYLKKISDETEKQLRESREEEKLAGDAKPVLEEAQNQIDKLNSRLDQLKEDQKNIEPLRLEVVDEPDDSATPSKPTTATPEKPAATEKKAN
jgi:hypothetical protein